MSDHTHRDNIPSFPTEFPFPLSDFNLDTVVNPSLVIDPDFEFDFDFDFEPEPEPDLDLELDALEQLFNTPGLLEHLLSEPDPLIDPSGLFGHLLQHSVLFQSDRYPPPPSRCPFANLRPANSPHSEPPPPPLSFLDNILNPPAPSDSLPFGYRRVSSPLNRPPPSIEASANMAPPRNQRPDRLPNGYVDLTAGPDSPSNPVPPPVTRRRRESPTPGPSSKRQKRENGLASTEQRRKSNTPAEVEQIDLSTDTPVQGVLQKQREEAVKAQQKPEEKATTFNSFTCVICMDTPTDLTATACGHLFCHTCLMEALIAGENRTGPNEPKRSQCPVCRKFINRSKTTDIIPLALKKGLATQPRMSSSSAAKATVAPKA